jgi:hypothetical protein
MGGVLDMKDVEEILSGLASQGFEGILSPTTEERLGKRGIQIPTPPKLTLEQSIDVIFSETRKQKALAIAKTLPQPPDIPVPSIQSLYNEIREAIILGLNGAAITLCGILVEHVLKYATYKVEIGGFAKYDSAKADEFERFALGSAIDRAAKAGLVTPDDIHKLRYFKDTYRNPYNHYNLKKITSNYYIEDVQVVDTNTGDVEVRDIAAKDDPIIQAQAKPRADADNVLEVFVFADSVVKAVWLRLTQGSDKPE